jgi:cytochrome c553
MLRFIVSLLAVCVALPAVAAGDVAAGKSKSQACAACHGANGNSATPTFPKLAGQHASYIVSQLQAFKNGKRKDPIMQGQVTNLKAQDMQDIAAYYASQEASVGAASDKAKRELGERLYRGGNQSKALPACMACHGPNAAGNPAAKYPALSGQHATYVVKSLKDYAAGTNRAFDDKDDTGKIMRDIAKRLTDKEMDAVAHYISGLH